MVRSWTQYSTWADDANLAELWFKENKPLALSTSYTDVFYKTAPQKKKKTQKAKDGGKRLQTTLA